MALTEFEKKVGSLTKQKKKKKTKLDETQLPVFSTTRKLIWQQQRKQGADRFGGGSPAKDYGKKGGMQPIEKAIDNTIKSKKAANLSTGSSIYNKTKANLNTAYKGKTSMHDINEGKFGHTAKPKGKIGDLQQITEDTKYGGMQTDKKGRVKTPKKINENKKKKKKLTLQQKAQESMGFKVGGRFGY